MTCHRKYTFEFESALTEAQVHHIDLELSLACDNLWWYTESLVTPASFTLHVAGRDQWWAHRRAMSLADKALYRLKLPVPTPTWEPAIPPHTNRGYSRSSP
jgi:hypothetical protein